MHIWGEIREAILGFMMSNKGIEVDTDKVKAI